MKYLSVLHLILANYCIGYNQLYIHHYPLKIHIPKKHSV